MADEKRRGGGPRTPEGKARSRENATTHGMRSKHLRVLSDESTEECEELRQNWLKEFRPQSFLEEQLVNQLILNSWLMLRANRRYTDSEAATDDEKLDLMQRYKNTAERAFYRSLETALRLKRDLLSYQITAAKLAAKNIELDQQIQVLRKDLDGEPRKRER